MSDWMAVSLAFPGWTLEEIKELSPRERKNWLNMAIGFKRSIVGS
jgi:hypothetical protein